MTTATKESVLAGLRPADREYITAKQLSLGVRDGAVYVRVACPRCGGSGHYSFCEMYGTRCLQCDVASGGKRIGWVWEPLARVLRRMRRADRLIAKREAAIERDAAATAGGFVSYEDVWNSARLLVDRVARERKAAAVAALRWVGTVGQRAEFTVCCRKVLRFDSYYGSFALVLTNDADGNEIVWKTSGAAVPDEGETVRIRGGVKEHGIYEKTGARQTTLERVRLLG